SRAHADGGGRHLRRGRIGQYRAGSHAGPGNLRCGPADSDAGQSPEPKIQMISARLRKTFSARPDSAPFSLELEFQAAAGVTVLFGPSGSCKTLTLDLIAGFERPDDGRILLDDEILFDGAAAVC